jgi:glycosyltransferase involved in cell wall biosynthesis
VTVLHHRRNYGQGRALCTAFEVCQSDIIVTLDADLSYGPEYIYSLVRAVIDRNVDIALASPYMKGGTVRNVPLYRYFLSRLGNAYLARMSQYSVSTSTCVVRAYRREALEGLILTSDGMELQLEILMKASLASYRVCEVPAKLEWADEKVAAADFRRASKMRILRSIRLYLVLGWLSRPSALFLFGSLFLILPSLYMGVAMIGRLVQAVAGYYGDAGWRSALSLGLQEVYATYSYGIIIYGLLFIVGLHMFAFGMLVMQNKSYFDEHYRVTSLLMKKLNVLKRGLDRTKAVAGERAPADSTDSRRLAG